jgi:membrane protease YdiL (CAAX protease family)
VSLLYLEIEIQPVVLPTVPYRHVRRWQRRGAKLPRRGQTSTWSLVTRNLMGTQKQEFVEKGATKAVAGASLREPVARHDINWKKAHRNVRRLQARIVKAKKGGKKRKVRALQFILTRSLSARALAVKRVTTNGGKRTPGIDGEVWDTPHQKAQAVAELRTKGYRPQPLRNTTESLIFPKRKENIMSTIMSFIKRQPVLTYYALTFAISWGGVLILGAPYGMPATSEQFEKLWTVVVLPYFLGPSVAGLLLTGLVHGRAGFRELLSRLLRWRVGAHWYAVALLTSPLLVTPLLLAFSLISPVFLPGILTAADKVSLILSGIVTGLIFGGLMEELGWTGFAVPTLRRRYGVVTTGLIVGVLHGVWHFPVKILISGTLGLAPFLAVDLLTAVFGLTAHRMLMVWVYDRTGSLLVTMLMHASLTACTLFILAPAATGAPLVTYNLVAAAAAWVVVAAVQGKKTLRQTGKAGLSRANVVPAHGLQDGPNHCETDAR